MILKKDGGKDFYCPNGHPVEFVENVASKQRVDKEGNFYIANENTLDCDNCHKKLHRVGPLNEGSFSCRGMCDFDLCTKCRTCSNGHLLQIQKMSKEDAIANKLQCA